MSEQCWCDRIEDGAEGGHICIPCQIRVLRASLRAVEQERDAEKVGRLTAQFFVAAAEQERDRLRAVLEKLQEETQRKYDEARQQQAACRKMDDDDGDSYHEGRADEFGHVLSRALLPLSHPTRAHDMSWNYRVVRCQEPDGSKYYEIREAFYPSLNDTTPTSITAAAARPGGSTVLELRQDLVLMLEAIDKPPLAEHDFASDDPLAFPPTPQEPEP